MSVTRLKNITKIGVEQMGELADRLQDPNVLRLENLDTDLRPPKSALDFTRNAALDDAANSYLPFFGLDETRKAATALVERQSGIMYDWKTESLISAGGLSGILNVLLATLEEGDEVLMTTPIYAGLINRVRLAGGIPRFIPLVPTETGWRLEAESLKIMNTGNVKGVLMMSPSMPTGAVLNHKEWKAITDFCRSKNCWLLYDSAMTQILFDGLEIIHPASFEDMRNRVITVGSASKEYRMIGWRVGWIVGPSEIIADTARVGISNVVCQTGIAMGAVATAIGDKNDGVRESVRTWEERRNLILQELKDYKIIKPNGGWSLLVDVSEFNMDGPAASTLLLNYGKVAATPMVNWGTEETKKYIRLVYSNEPIERLRGLKKRFDDSLRR